MSVDYAPLRRLLRRRLDLVADHGWRDRDPAGHLAALAETSEAISAWHRENRSAIPARLHHFLSQSSLNKALEWIDTAAGSDSTAS